MNSLFAKLSLALFLIVALVGTSIFFTVQIGTRSYYEEITQRLNASIAMYVTNERQLINGGVVDRAALSMLAEQAMIINPTVEIYLLDRQGTIIAHALPDKVLPIDRVDLAAVNALLEGDVDMPHRGTDPRNAGMLKIFSAFPVTQDGIVHGYLYAILGGRKYDEIASSLWGSYVLKVSAFAIVTIMLVALITGLLVFGLLTRRLSRLTSDVRRFTEADFEPSALMPTVNADEQGSADEGRGDEIAALRDAFGRMALRIREQLQRLEETDRLRRELVTNVSHDLRTPLASMSGYVETLLINDERLTPSQRRNYLKISHKHTQRLTQLVGDLFELSKLESAITRPALERFSLAELLHDVAQEFEILARNQEVRIETVAGDGDSTVYADIGLMQRVLENLIRNALQHTPHGGCIRLELENHVHSVSVAVADTGRGIAADDLERVFDRFYTNSDSDRHESMSAGLGLAIVRKILELHDSRIVVESVVDRGTRFEFSLAAAAAA